MNRYDIYEIPMDAIREALVNAIIHRDYSMGGTNIMVEVHADRVEISNPGGLPAGFPTSMLGKKSFRRNELIADLFHRMDKSERMGSGIERIRRTLKLAGVKAPKFESDLFFTMARALGITLDGVKYHLTVLQRVRAIRRVGGRKIGRWECL